MFLRAVLLSCAIANAAAFIAPSRAPQLLAPQLAAVLPPRALPTASVLRREEVAKQVCGPHPVALRASRAWPRCLHKGYGGRKGSPECIPSKCLCSPPTPYVQSLLSV